MPENARSTTSPTTIVQPTAQPTTTPEPSLDAKIGKMLMIGFHGLVHRILDQGGTLFLAIQEGMGEGWEHTTRYGKPVERFLARHRAEEMTTLLVEGGFALRDHTADSAGARHWLRYLCTS
jgi:hypothetical protein